jgi:hypothetical protein
MRRGRDLGLRCRRWGWLDSDGAAEFEFIDCIRAGWLEQPMFYWLLVSRKARCSQYHMKEAAIT